MIINKTTYQVQTMSTYPDTNWMGDEWALVPAQLQTKVLQYSPYCELVWFDGELVDIVGNVYTDLSPLKEHKIVNLSATCRDTIIAGVTVNDKHYSLKEDDQINIGNLAMAASTGQPVLYHADNELCEIYTAQEFLALTQAVTEYKIYHTTYFNHLKAWVQRSTTVDEINGITYGSPLPPDLALHMAGLLGEPIGEQP